MARCREEHLDHVIWSESGNIPISSMVLVAAEHTSLAAFRGFLIWLHQQHQLDRMVVAEAHQILEKGDYLAPLHGGLWPHGVPLVFLMDYLPPSRLAEFPNQQLGLDISSPETEKDEIRPPGPVIPDRTSSMHAVQRRRVEIRERQQRLQRQLSDESIEPDSISISNSASRWLNSKRRSRTWIETKPASDTWRIRSMQQHTRVGRRLRLPRLHPGLRRAA
ncbi:MAG: hypothetical protein M1826_000105 [Phylliscum demangeonii]|nr:MAG: hypothetical protein M1826_000105 [Phylliscum demangeonii]